MAGILRHSRALTAFTNPLPNSYLRFGCDEAPRYVSWSRQNRSQLVRIPVAQGSSCRMELRSPDPACNPYLAIALVLAAGLDGIEKKMTLSAPVNKNLFAPGAEALGLESLPLSLEEAVAAAQQSEFVREVLPEGLAQRYFAEQLHRCEALKTAADPAEYERTHYFCAI
jgi:glutamine synthetase